MSEASRELPSAEVLPAEVLRALEEQVPDADLAAATVIGRGWDVVAWRLPATDGDWTLRVPRLIEARATIAAQTCLGERLAAEDLPVPREPRLLHDAHGGVLGGLYRYVEGDLARVSGRAARARLATSIAGFLSRLHALDPGIGVACGGTPYEPWRDLFAPVVERSAPLLPAASEAWVRATAARLAEASRALPPPRLLHADLKPAHVLVDAGQRIVGVLDFEGIQVSDPALDFSRLIQNWDAAFAASVLKHYRGNVDEYFMVRAQCYRDFDAIHTIDTEVERGWSEWTPWARRQIAARAAAAARRRGHVGGQTSR